MKIILINDHGDRQTLVVDDDLAKQIAGTEILLIGTSYWLYYGIENQMPAFSQTSSPVEIKTYQIEY